MKISRKKLTLLLVAIPTTSLVAYIIFLFIYSWWNFGRTLIPPVTTTQQQEYVSPEIKDISTNVRFQVQPQYYLSEQVNHFEIPIDIEFPEQLFRKNCNHQGKLQRKNGRIWETVMDDKCEKDYQPTAPLESSETFAYYFRIEFGVPGLSHYKYNWTGTYRIKLEMAYGCKEIGKESNNYSIIFGNCKGNAVAYSPEFKIISK